jgi:hypothetical protein
VLVPTLLEVEVVSLGLHNYDPHNFGSSGIGMEVTTVYRVVGGLIPLPWT